MHIHIQAYTSRKKISDCLIYCILSNGEVIKYQKFISVVVIELSVRCLNTGPEDRLGNSIWGLIITLVRSSCLLSYLGGPNHRHLLCILTILERFDLGTPLLQTMLGETGSSP